MPAKESEVFFTWKSLSRPFKKRDRDFFVNIAAIVFLICVILLFIKEWFLIIAILALTFVVFILNTVPPEEVGQGITNKGIRTAGAEYEWRDLTDFFFTEKYGARLLNIKTKKTPYGRLILLVNKEDEGKIKEILEKHLTFIEKPEVNFLDKAADWLGKKVPLEK